VFRSWVFQPAVFEGTPISSKVRIEVNLLETNPEEGSFLAFRFYGPTEALTSGEWKLNDPVLIE
jgi:hypothetical protein